MVDTVWQVAALLVARRTAEIPHREHRRDHLLSSEPASLGPTELKIALGLADMATVAILNQRALHRAEPAAERLPNTLNSRVLIEQAKGILAEQNDLDMDAAFAVLRNHTRRRHQGRAEAARAVVNGSLTLQGDGRPGRSTAGR
jgi:hypothetical protein